jgi:muramidase (phage lysozyme)
MSWSHRVAPASRPSAFSDLERHIRACESGDLHTTYDYSMHQGPSTASGAWQVLDTTWEGYGGYGRAYEAPREVQDRWARHYFDANGYTAWAASRRCWGG